MARSDTGNAECGESSGARATPVRVLIADEFPIFRDGLRLLLSADGRLQIVGDIGIGPAATALVRELHPDILLLGSSPTCSTKWLEIVKEIAAATPAVRTILLVKSMEMPEIIDALKCGACAVVARDSEENSLLNSIDSVIAGDCWIGGERVAGDAAAMLRRLGQARQNARRFGLTSRELDIARRVMSGDTNHEIAERLAISENTVKRHVLNMFDKVGVSTRVELALFVAYHRVLDDS
jgi:two-component system, NarL family, nitrate/nitrite response regulator NarL